MSRKSSAARISIFLPPSADAVAERIARERGITKNAVFRLALGVLDVHEQALARGEYVGAARDREKLDTLIVAPL